MTSNQYLKALQMSGIERCPYLAIKAPKIYKEMKQEHARQSTGNSVVVELGKPTRLENPSALNTNIRTPEDLSDCDEKNSRGWVIAR